MTPRLRDPRGRVLIDSPRTPFEESITVAGATSIIHALDGTMLGVYVDNETPNRDEVAAEMVQGLPGLQVVVGCYPSEIHKRIRGCVCAVEWYPFHRGWGWPTFYGPEAWILQWDFAWPGDEPPTHKQRRRLLRRTRLLHPRARLIWTF